MLIEFDTYKSTLAESDKLLSISVLLKSNLGENFMHSLLASKERVKIVNVTADSLHSLRDANVILLSKNAYSTATLRKVSNAKFHIERELRLTETLAMQLKELQYEDTAEELISSSMLLKRDSPLQTCLLQ
jgi:hypothetical protein